MNIMAGICLLIQGIWDLRKKEIPTCISIGFGGVSLIYSIYGQRASEDIFLGVLPGILFLLIGLVTKQAVGYGDGILLCALGMYYALEDLLSICLIAMVFSVVVALILLVVFHKNGKYEIPFVPFLFLGWLFWYGIRALEGGLL